VTVAGYQTVAQQNLTCAIRIRERRKDLGLTQAEVVERVSRHGSRLSNQALSAIENGRRLAVGRLPDLAFALDCTVTYLIGLTADPHRWQPDGPDAAESSTAPDTPKRSPAPDVPPRAPGPAVRDLVSQSRRNWILGPDVPGVPAELGSRAYQSDPPLPARRTPSEPSSRVRPH
jgi:transcriptional regulator with XRE-family HTH domain